MKSYIYKKNIKNINKYCVECENFKIGFLMKNTNRTYLYVYMKLYSIINDLVSLNINSLILYRFNNNIIQCNLIWSFTKIFCKKNFYIYICFQAYFLFFLDFDAQI